MFDPRHASEWKALFKYYQAGIVNTAFGYGAFSLLVWMGLNIYLAQVIAHVSGVVFNYLTYSRYTFSDYRASKRNFVLSYAVNYLLNLAVLWALNQVIRSPYLAGFITIIVVSIINYVVLRRYVFRARTI